MTKIYKNQFQINGRFTGSRLAGRENEYIYEIFYNGKKVSDHQWTSKKRAEEWLDKTVRVANEILKSKNNQ